MSHKLIHKWIEQGEGTTIELKVMMPDVYKIARTISAFANTKGGKIIVGVTDDGEIVGVVDPAQVQSDFLAAATEICYPSIELTFDEYTENYLTVVVATIGESANKPHTVYNHNGIEKVYIRTDAKTMPASKMVIKLLKEEFLGELRPHRALTTKELGLVDYLHKRERITLKEFMQVMNLSKRRARRMLVDLVQEGILRVHDASKEDFYTLS